MDMLPSTMLLHITQPQFITSLLQYIMQLPFTSQLHIMPQLSTNQLHMLPQLYISQLYTQLQLIMPQPQLMEKNQLDQLSMNTDMLYMTTTLKLTSKPTNTVMDTPLEVNTVSIFPMVVLKS